MAVKIPLIENKVVARAEPWVERLGRLLKVLDEMDPEERAASLTYARSRFRSDWPSSDSY